MTYVALTEELKPPADGRGGSYLLVLEHAMPAHEGADEKVRAEMRARMKGFMEHVKTLGPLIERQAPKEERSKDFATNCLGVHVWARGLIMPPGLSPEEEADARRMFAEISIN